MKVGFIGTGNMGGALAHAAAQSPAPAELLLSNRTPEKAQALAQQLGATVSDNETIAQTCDYIFLGVKPQMMADLLARLRPILSRRQEGFVLVSMAAGLTLQRLGEMAGLSCPILRIMPNTACAVGAGLTLYVPSPEVTELLLHRLGVLLRLGGLTLLALLGLGTAAAVIIVISRLVLGIIRLRLVLRGGGGSLGLGFFLGSGLGVDRLDLHLMLLRQMLEDQVDLVRGQHLRRLLAPVLIGTQNGQNVLRRKAEVLCHIGYLVLVHCSSQIIAPPCVVISAYCFS